MGLSIQQLDVFVVCHYWQSIIYNVLLKLMLFPPGGVCGAQESVSTALCLVCSVWKSHTHLGVV